ncbi:MAG TPA: hypothetical protein VMS04_22655 [Vicinamibacterales bacterium]|nr:hypothetical protein [Vicinamibacterales bacterium]
MPDVASPRFDVERFQEFGGRVVGCCRGEDLLHPVVAKHRCRTAANHGGERTLASATSCTALFARRLEVFEHVGLRDAASLQLPGDVAAQHVVQFALELDRKGDLRSREEDPGQTPASRHENWRSGTY